MDWQLQRLRKTVEQLPVTKQLHKLLASFAALKEESKLLAGRTVQTRRTGKRPGCPSWLLLNHGQLD